MLPGGIKLALLLALFVIAVCFVEEQVCFGPRRSTDLASWWLLRSDDEPASASVPSELCFPLPLCRCAIVYSIGGAGVGSWFVGGAARLRAIGVVSVVSPVTQTAAGFLLLGEQALVSTATTTSSGRWFFGTLAWVTSHTWGWLAPDTRMQRSDSGGTPPARFGRKRRRDQEGLQCNFSLFLGLLVGLGL